MMVHNGSNFSNFSARKRISQVKENFLTKLIPPSPKKNGFFFILKDFFKLYIVHNFVVIFLF